MAMLGYTNVHYIPVRKKPGSIMRVPPGRKMQSGSGMIQQQGGNFWGSVSNWFAPVVHEIDDVLKETKVISTYAPKAGAAIGGFLGSEVPIVGTALGGLIGGGVGSVVGNIAKQKGYGKKRKGRKPGPKKKRKRKK